MLYILDYPFNLISISKRTHTKIYSVIFANNYVHVQDRRTGQTIGARLESQGLYYLSQWIACISTVSQALEHPCLGRHQNASHAFQSVLEFVFSIRVFPVRKTQSLYIWYSSQ